jgi:hypothetical protein
MYEELAAFTTTHLTMITLLMPWKKVVHTTTVGTEVTKVNYLFTLWDMLNREDFISMVDGVATDDTSLATIIHVIIGLLGTLLFFSVGSFVVKQYTKFGNADLFLAVDFVNWGLILSVLVLALTNQTDYDAVAEKDVSSSAAYDTDKMFLSIGVLAVQLTISTVFVGKSLMDKFKK